MEIRMRHALLLFSIVASAWVLNYRASAIDVSLTSNYGEAFPINTTVTFFAAATNTNSVTTYTWDFDDGTGSVVTVVPTIDHVFTVVDIYTVTVSVDNGIDVPGGDFDFFEAVDPPDPADATKPIGINNGDPVDLNPDENFSFSLDQAQFGYISGSLSMTTPLLRAASSFVTDFGDGVSGRNGSELKHQYTDPTAHIFIMSSTSSVGGSTAGNLRKTLVFSNAELPDSTQDPLVMNLPLLSRKLKFKALKGKFNFAANTVPMSTRPRIVASTDDTVSVSWTMTLPAGFDVNTQVVDIAIGNVVDKVTLTNNGTGVIDSPSPFKSVKFKFPRLKKGQTRSLAATTSIVTVKMSSADLPSQGFDTEGITPRAFANTGSKGPYSRSIQVATYFAGVSYSGIANVALTVSSNGSFGSIVGRSSRP